MRSFSRRVRAFARDVGNTVATKLNPCGAIGKHSEDRNRKRLFGLLGGLSSLTSPLLVHGRSFSHIQFAVKQDQALGHAVLRQVKAGQLPLGRVSFALLLSLVRTVRERFYEPVVQHHAATFGEAWAKASPWLASATSALLPLSPEALLAPTVRTSVTTSFDHIMPSLPTVFDGTPGGRRPNLRSAAGHWVAVLDELERLQPLAVLEHAAGVQARAAAARGYSNAHLAAAANSGSGASSWCCCCARPCSRATSPRA